MDKAALRLTLFGLLFTCVNLAAEKKKIDIYSFHINCTVTGRYATTVITSRVANVLNKSQEVNFEVQIPKNAFISQFRMTIDGKTYDAIVKEKEEAQQEYSQAVSRGESAGLVSAVGRTLEEFKTSVTVAANSKVTFELTYEELLKRRLGKYKLLINAQPMQPVADFKIDIHIHESAGISLLEVKGGLNTKDLANAVTTTRAQEDAWVKFYPTRDQQKDCDDCTKNGLNGNLVIMYDVERVKQSGDFKVANGYFVHYFAPTDVQRIPKNVVFIIDQSGSMQGNKIEQTRMAMLRILSDLAKDDYFGLITFSSHIQAWKPELLKATAENVEEAKTFVKQIRSGGATDINGAVLNAVNMINQYTQEGSASILILLTDGDPTSGVTNPVTIQQNVKTAIGGKYPLYCLGFGFNVRFEFLEKMSLENNGAARRIYEDSDADLQLQGFYEEVAIPLLTNVQLNYQGVAKVTQTTFSQYYNGSEIVVAGYITDNSLESLTTEVIALSKSTKVVYNDSVLTDDFKNDGLEHGNYISRLWAFLTVKQLLAKTMLLKGQEKDNAKKEALDLSLKYKFVTPLTSMVVTKPQGDEVQVAVKPNEEKRHSSGRKQTSKDSTRMHLAASPDDMHYFKTPTRHHHGSRNKIASRRPIQHSFRKIPIFAPDYHDLFDAELGMRYQLPKTTQKPLATSPPWKSIRILKSSGNAQPICYDVPFALNVRLQQNDPTEFYMNGELEAMGGKGFKQIDISYKTNHQLRLSATKIDYSYGSESMTFSWDQELTHHETEHVSLVLRSNEMDITMGNMRIVILLHKEDGSVFLWPAVLQQPKDVSSSGILGEAEVSYEVILGLQTSILKLKEQVVKASWVTMKDYRLPAAPVIGCWLVPFEAVTQKTISDFAITQP
ncbi:inter-alpha-trypsin inhibitor heavy chain H3b precursor [Danio rerio]|uniref:Inter-alpha (Globulin) inhibitor H3 n=1 Tax=Danio rerio TaxID=7955 RepID=Q498Q0_DANRE|nr:inter-alpha-trypsin inhibitor heavy chain H3b precursor [Danio rerio]AAI00122.1 Inter-alpha (globulin) inhibitor H3 [Danio rerio]|eukprot:NP_001028276.1 inter-alpha-trypsin inhibitor heavy chain 3b precursor [Danio rerio]